MKDENNNIKIDNIKYNKISPNSKNGLCEVIPLNYSIKKNEKQKLKNKTEENKTGILVISSYPPRECGIATYTQDLVKAINTAFGDSTKINICALEDGISDFSYPDEVKYILNTEIEEDYKTTLRAINSDSGISSIIIQHEFGFFNKMETAFFNFVLELKKPVIIAFHTVLPNPEDLMKSKIQSISKICEKTIVMTNNAKNILVNDYDISPDKISVIAHGTHLVSMISGELLKQKYGLSGKIVLSTFGLLSSGKSIETTIDALPEIVKKRPDVMFLIIGKTHPNVVKNEGEKYRQYLEQKVKDYSLEKNVTFINNYLSTAVLLEYLQLTDIYLFTTNDRNQAVSGTFAYAMSCACPIISTPIPHAKEFLTNETGIIFDFGNSKQLTKSVLKLLNDDSLRKTLSTNALQKIVPTSWNNSAVAHVKLIDRNAVREIKLKYNLPEVNLCHIKKMTTEKGLIQFSKINQPDIESGYTLDDNARALVAICMYFKQTQDITLIPYIRKYLAFMGFCQQDSGKMYNYVDKNEAYTNQNTDVNLDDSNGRAVWALGYLISLTDILPYKIILDAERILKMLLVNTTDIYSTRAMAFAIKGLYYYKNESNNSDIVPIVKTLSNRLVQMLKHESTEKWTWFEGYLTYANSILPEAMLYAWLMMNEKKYLDAANTSLEFLLDHTFNNEWIEVISNRNWLTRGEKNIHVGEQPIDVSYTIMTLSMFYNVFHETRYKDKMETAFSWFLGNNRLHQIVYNPCTGGCFDGLEENNVNLNQGAESTLSYLMARLTVGNSL
jgi:glycosyltransferase involved in cell wall biosynthesis